MTINASNVTTTLVIPRALRAEVQEYCGREGISMGMVMRELLVKHMAAQKAQGGQEQEQEEREEETA